MAATRRVKKAARQTVRTVAKYATPKEGADAVREITKAGRQPRLRRKAVRQVRRELGAAAAQKFRKKIRILDVKTAAAPRRREAARKAARKTQRRLQK